MDYKISFKSSVYKDLKKIDKTKVAQILDKIENHLSNSPESYPQLTGKFSGLRKYRVGNYRIIYSILDNTILVLRISHRKDAYRK